MSEAMPEAARRVWELVRDQVADGILEADRARCEEALARREDGGWPDAIAGEMERHYSPGRTWESLAHGFLGVVRAGDVLDVGGGDGTIAELLAPRCKSYTLLDRSERVVTAAKKRLGGTAVRIERGDMHRLPFADARFDQVLLLNVLQHSERPDRAVREAARVLRPDGQLTVVTLAAHSHGEITGRYGHVNAGFEPDELSALLRDAALAPSFCEVTSRERRAPHFRVVTAFANKSSKT